MIDVACASRVQESFARQGLMRTLGATLTHIASGSCEIRCRAADALTQQNGFVHAGVLTALADTAGGYAALTLTEPGEDVLAVEFKINFLEPARGEEVLARGRVLRHGRRLFVCQIETLHFEGGTFVVCASGLQTVARVTAR